MQEIYLLDLAFLFCKHTICSFLIKAKPPVVGDILVESGPHTTLDALKAGLEAQNSSLSSVRHVFLTHIHFDHAGAAWALAEEGAQVYVHPAGLAHLADPTKLTSSATRIYGKDMDRLWGKIKSIPLNQLHAAEDGAIFDVGGLRLQAHHTPGHASHHIAWQLEEALFTGDVAGVRIGGGPAVPPCPPPDLDVAAWQSSLKKIAQLGARILYLTHYGAIEKDINSHLSEVSHRLDELVRWMRTEASNYPDQESLQTAFAERTQLELKASGLSDEQISAYLAANPPFMSVLGLQRYLKKLPTIP